MTRPLVRRLATDLRSVLPKTKGSVAAFCPELSIRITASAGKVLPRFLKLKKSVAVVSECGSPPDAISIVVYQCAASTLTERASEIEALLKGMEATPQKSGLAARRHTEKDMRVPTSSTEAWCARIEAGACRPHFKQT
jgi:hypothetical protein